MIEKYFSVGHKYQSYSFVLCKDTRMFSPLHFAVACDFSRCSENVYNCIAVT